MNKNSGKRVTGSHPAGVMRKIELAGANNHPLACMAGEFGLLSSAIGRIILPGGEGIGLFLKRSLL
jgi:hypothetical protein